jgi:hypothetical protein
MKKLNEKLSEVFDIEPLEIKTEVVEVKQIIEDDADFARQNIRHLIEKGNQAVDNILNVAKESEKARDYEVAANLIKSLSDLNKDLMEIQKRKKDLSSSKNDSPINVDKAVFVGSTNELMKLLKSNK